MLKAHRQRSSWTRIKSSKSDGRKLKTI